MDFAFKMSFFTESTLGFTLKMESVFKKYHFWLRNDGEKWSRKICFDIPPRRNIDIFITEFLILGTFMQ